MKQPKKNQQKNRLKARVKFLAFYVRYKELRLLLREEKAKGEQIGWGKAQKDRQQTEDELRERHQVFVDNERELADRKLEQRDYAHRKELEQLEEKYLSLLSEKDAAHKVERVKLRMENDTERVELREYHRDRIKHNNQLREDAVKQCDLIRTSYRRSEDYWRNQILKLNDFLSAAMAVVRTVSERYEWLQGNIAKVTVGAEMVEGLQERYKALVKDAHTGAPPLVGNKEFKKKGV